MKKLVVVAGLLAFGVSQAQVKFGLKAGYANSKIESSEFEESLGEELGVTFANKAKSGFYVGAFAEYMITEKFSLQGEVQYANLGGQLEGSYNDNGIRFTLVDQMNFNQILVPLTAKYYATPKLGFYAGPSVAFNAGYKVDVRIEDTNIPQEYVSAFNQAIREVENQQEDSMKDYLKSTNFNMLFGAEYTVYKGLFVDARYTVGLSNYEEEPYEGSRTKLNYFQVGLGYKF